MQSFSPNPNFSFSPGSLGFNESTPMESFPLPFPAEAYQPVSLTAVEGVDFPNDLKAAMTKKAAGEDASALMTCPICQSKLIWIKRHVEEGHIVSLSSRLLKGDSFDLRTDLIWLTMMAIRLQRRAPKNRPHPRDARREGDELLGHLSLPMSERPGYLSLPALRMYGVAYAQNRAPVLVCGYCPERFTRPETKARHEKNCPHRE
ncbi:hypothetical protein DL93DRAFT_2080768 [Clavulina sp. PMI_390]|nr:hypothetical protein DL93DRAFT_2080768 [Clavulina sp. PMI_390]